MINKPFSRQIALVQILLMGSHALAQTPGGPDPVALAESYLLNATESVKKNAPLEDTHQWVRKMEETVMRAQPRDATDAKALAAILSEGQKLYADRRSELEALMRRIEALKKQKRLNSARDEARKAPRPGGESRKLSKDYQQKQFDDIGDQIAKDIERAAEYERLGDDLAARGSCHDGPRVRDYYRKAQEINIEFNVGAKTIPGPCPPSTCGGKCKTTLVLLGMAAGAAAGFCVYDSRRDRSCLDRVR